MPAHVSSVGPDAIEDEKLGLVYKACVALDRVTIIRDGERVSLNAGMAATADIKTGRRSILSYLLSPIDEARLNAARER